MVALADAGRIQAVGAGFRVSRQPPDHLVDIVSPHEKTLRASSQHHAAVADRSLCRPNPFRGELYFIKRLIPSPAVVLNRQSSDARFDAAPHILGDAVRIIRITVLEVGVQRKVRRFHQLTNVRQHQVEPHRAISQSPRKCESRGSGREGLKAQVLKITSTPDIPRIRQREATAIVKLAKSFPSFRDCRHDRPSLHLNSSLVTRHLSLVTGHSFGDKSSGR